MTNIKGYCTFALILTCLIFLQLAGSRPLLAAPGAIAAKRQVVIIVVDQITWNDFKTMPVIQELALKGTVGLMTTNPAGGQRRIPDNTYATIGAGAKIGGGPTGGMALNAHEPYLNGLASDEFYRRTGRRTAGQEVVNLGIVQMEKANLKLRYGFSPGALGTILHQNGLKTAVLGNADTTSADLLEHRFQRQAAAIAMDASGRVDFGDVSARTTKSDPESLAGVSTDFAYLLRGFDDLRNKADLVVLETGDTSRLNTMETIGSKKAVYQQRQKVLANVDIFVGSLLQRLNLKRDLVMVVVPGPSDKAMAEARYLTPFVMAGQGVIPGMAWSGTTKREGLVANTDITASVLTHFGIPPVIKGKSGETAIMLGGQAIKSKFTAEPLAAISKIEADAVFSFNARYPLVKGYINSALVMVALAAAGLLLKEQTVKYISPVLLGLTAVPGVMLWVKYFPRASIVMLILEVLAVTALITWAALRLGRRNPLRSYLVTTGFTALLVVTDILAGAPLAKTSPFSYDVMIGARFYGIGNEYMGVVIGCVIVFTGLILDMVKNVRIIKPALLSMFLAVVYIIAAPNLGTNVGGTIAALAGFGAAVMLIFGGSLNKTSVLAICGSIVVVLAGFMIYDMTRAVEAQSHIGRTVALIRENGFSEMANIISRKLEVNTRLILSTTWSWFYFLSLLVILVFNRVLPRQTADFRQRNPWFSTMLSGVIIGSIFALIFNDSGIVAAATMIIFAVAPYLTGIMSEEWRVGSGE